jgi:hypothetical protein
MDEAEHREASEVSSVHMRSNTQALWLPPWAASAWAVVGVAATLVMAVYRLGLRTRTLLETDLAPHAWWLLGASTLLFAYGEGYRALHLRFVPAVIARAAELTPMVKVTLRIRLLAPLYALGIVQSDRTARMRAWLSIALIGLAVVVVRQLPEPWRGIIDASVTVALAIGLSSLALGFVNWLRTARTHASFNRPAL